MVLEVLDTTMRQIKLTLFADDMILYTKKPKHSTKKLLELINEFSKVARYKIHFQKSVAFLYTNNKLSEWEIRKHCHSQLLQKNT